MAAAPYGPRNTEPKAKGVCTSLVGLTSRPHYSSDLFFAGTMEVHAQIVSIYAAVKHSADTWQIDCGRRMRNTQRRRITSQRNARVHVCARVRAVETTMPRLTHERRADLPHGSSIESAGYDHGGGNAKRRRVGRTPLQLRRIRRGLYAHVQRSMRRPAVRRRTLQDDRRRMPS